MNDFGFNDYNALFQRMYGQQKPQKDKAGWLDPVMTGLGAAGGFMIGGPPGAMAGASIGHGVGDASKAAVNGDLNMQRALLDAGTIGAGWSGMNGLFFAEGGPVPEIEQTDAYGNPIQPQAQGNPMSMLTPELIAQLQQHAQTLAGQAPKRPTVENGGLAQTRTASHPTLEALATLMPTILGSLPKPANPKNTKAIGAWAPFAGNALAAPALIAQSRRKAANAPIEDANTQAQSDYEARQKAYEDQKKAYGTALIQGAMRPQKEGEQVISVELAKRYGHPEWAGMTESQVRLKLAGEPKPDKPETITPAQRLSFLNTLSDNIRQDKDISNFIVVRDNFKRINSAARAGTGVDDMSLIFAYMKVLDPTSVVRESEYKNAAQAIGLIPQLANIPANWLSGQKLTPAGRAGFVAAARRLYEQQRQSYRDAIEMYRNQAREYGVNPAVVIRNYEAQDFAPTDGSGAASPASPTKPKVGQRVQ